MHKVCGCCAEPELPNISFNVTCVCCKSKVDEFNVKDVRKVDEVDGKEEQVSCCCFRIRRKRHAKAQKDEEVIESIDGTDT